MRPEADQDRALLIDHPAVEGDFRLEWLANGTGEGRLFHRSH
jgi:hypothetical protein